MRCDNCGWSNPEGLAKCQKCNQNLNESQDSHDSVACMHCGYLLSSANVCCPNCGTKATQTSHGSPNAKTVRVLSGDGQKLGAMKATVREIRFEPLDKNPATKNLDNMKTVKMLTEEFLKNERPVTPSVKAGPAQLGFKLVPLDNFDGQAFQSLIFSGDSVSVGRNDIPECDTFVMDDVQVECEYVNGQWAVSEKNGKKVVFVAASHKILLKSGDVIVIGNRRYIFE